MDGTLDKFLNIVLVIIVGAFGSLVRLIHTKPQMFTFLIIVTEMIVGGFVGWLVYVSLITFTTLDFSVISIYCALSGVMSREFIGFLIRFIKKEAYNKYRIEIK